LRTGFDQKYREIYEQISKIANGQDLPSLNSEEKSRYQIAESASQLEAGIPNYWGTCLKNSNYFPVNEKDEKILTHLRDIRMKPLNSDGNLDFVIEFEFSPNEYFTQTLLTKTYFFDKEEEIEKTQGCQIFWATNDKNPRIKIATKKVKKGKKVETKTSESNVPSFFDIFADESKDKLNPDEVNFFKEDFFPGSVEYYLNLVEGLDDDGEFDDDEDFDDDDEEDENDDKGKKGTKKTKNKSNPGAAGQEKCKNQ
jgi:nucleosome assembly protein 1-like 1